MSLSATLIVSDEHIRQAVSQWLRRQGIQGTVERFDYHEGGDQRDPYPPTVTCTVAVTVMGLKEIP